MQTRQTGRQTAQDSASTPNGCQRPPRARGADVSAALALEAKARAAAAVALELSRDIDIGTWVYELTAPLRVWEPDDTPSSDIRDLVLWQDLRPTEAKVLEGLVEEIYATASAIETDAVSRIVDLVAEKAVTFGRRFPDAPRGAWRGSGSTSAEG